ncbi:hypothetical protein [Auritidibacter ignavus]|uniref:hypothetical protein n=1 Tax=Auritidibacter ignavus TaxID=678932 RepID=UPI000F0303B1|nr:hypothetical protein [Auritidibacter ignavus]NIH70505.1 hypothetical protein [Auritidibacter ignavus]RMX23306.1 hypothetical protein DYI20_05420 [Auritidibacter ignavus]
MSDGLKWVRVETAIPRNPKILELIGSKGGHRAAAVYIFSLAYSGENGTFGFIPKAGLPFIHATTKDANTLVRAKLWEAVDGGWVIPDWDEYQPSKEYMEELSAKRREAANARWSRQHHKVGGMKVVRQGA